MAWVKKNFGFNICIWFNCQVKCTFWLNNYKIQLFFTKIFMLGNLSIFRPQGQRENLKVVYYIRLSHHQQENSICQLIG
jgi:hypothetical protein